MIDIIDIARLTLIFIFSFFSSFLWHELCHGLEAIRQGSSKANIIVKPWTMMTGGDHITNSKLFFLAGGLYSGIIFILAGLLTIDPYFRFSFLTVGLMNVFYSYYEMEYITKHSPSIYRAIRYSIYFLTILGMTCLFYFLGYIP